MTKMETPQQEKGGGVPQNIRSYVEETYKDLEDQRDSGLERLERLDRVAGDIPGTIARLMEDIKDMRVAFDKDLQTLDEEWWTKLEHDCVRIADDFAAFDRKHREAYLDAASGRTDAVIGEIAPESEFADLAAMADRQEDLERLRGEFGRLKEKEDARQEKGRKEAEEAAVVIDPFLKFIDKARSMVDDVGRRLRDRGAALETGDQTGTDAELDAAMKRHGDFRNRGALHGFLHRNEDKELAREVDRLKEKSAAQHASRKQAALRESRDLQRLMEHLENVTGSEATMKRMSDELAWAEWDEGKKMTAEDAKALGSRQRYVEALKTMERKRSA